MKAKFVVLLFYFISINLQAQLSPMLTLQSGHSTAISMMQFSVGDKFLLSIDRLNNCVLWSLQSYKQYGSIEGIQSTIRAALVNVSSQNVFILCENGTMYIYNLSDLQKIKEEKICENVNAATVFENVIYFIQGSEILFYSSETGKSQSLYKRENEAFSSIDANEQYIVASSKSRNSTILFNKLTFSEEATIAPRLESVFLSQNVVAGLSKKGNVYSFRKKNGKLNMEINMTSDNFGDKIIDVAVAEKVLVYTTNNGRLLTLMNQNGLKKWRQYSDDKITCIKFCDDLLYVGFENGEINILNHQNGEVMHQLHGQTKNYYKLHLSSDDESILCANYNNEISILPLSPFNDSWSLSFEDYLPISKDVFYRVNAITTFDSSKTEFSLLAIKNIQNNKENFNLVIDEYNCKWTYKSNDFSVTKIKQSKTKIKYDETKNSTSKTRLLNKKYNLYIEQDKSGMIAVSSAINDSLLFSFYKKTNEEFIFVKDNFYFGAKNSLQSVGYRFNNNVYGVETFDRYYNRPDLIFKNCNFIDREVYDNIVKAVKKRIKGEVPDFEEGDVPVINLSLSNDDGAPFERTAKINFESKNSPIETITVFINGSPVTKLDHFENAFVGNIEVKLELESGKNLINCIGINQKSISSLNTSVEVFVNEKPTDEVQNYIVCIGSGKFVENDYNLTFPAKDASDIANKFSSFNKKTKVLLIQDENVTNKSVDTIAFFLANSKPSDKVILFFAGHGVLNKEFEYYLSTYDMNFNAPEQKGISFQRLEHMLANAPARNKILLIDACHSGEIDKEDIIITTNKDNETENQTDLKFRSINGAPLVKNNSQGLLEFSKNLFLNYSNSTGINIVSSSSGYEFSMESEEWNNGLFTYCVLKALEFSNSDADSDNQIDLSEFSYYIKYHVSKMSMGKQNPSLRSDNLYKTIYLR